MDLDWTQRTVLAYLLEIRIIGINVSLVCANPRCAASPHRSLDRMYWGKSMYETSHLTQVEAAIVRTVAYADIFNFPLLTSEIQRYLFDVAATLDDVAAGLAPGLAQIGRC